MGEHTPTPWQISPVRTTEDTAMIVGGAGFEFGLIADVTEDFDAAFIVKAVNNHDALVNALERAIIDLDAARIFVECHEEAPAHGIRQTLEIARKALRESASTPDLHGEGG